MLEASIPMTRPEAPELTELTTPVQHLMADLDDVLAEQVACFETEVRSLAAYALRASGKRLRPLLVFFSGMGNRESRRAELARAGAVVELIHVATLVHDDILDDAELRHRQETVAAKYGSQTAVLLGDALFAQALRLATSFPTVEVCRTVAEATRRVCAGEISQTLHNGGVVDRARYFRVIELKTAELFRASCYLGALLSGQDTAGRDDSAEFGRQLGIAYQIYDDLADFLADEVKAGKTLGTDLASGKTTLPLIFLQERKPETIEWISNREQFRTDADAVRRLIAEMRSVEAFDASREILDGSLEKADAAASRLQDRAAAEALHGLVAFLRAQVERI